MLTARYVETHPLLGGQRVFDPDDRRDVTLVASITERHPTPVVDWDDELNRIDRFMRSNRYCRL